MFKVTYKSMLLLMLIFSVFYSPVLAIAKTSYEDTSNCVAAEEKGIRSSSRSIEKDVSPNGLFTTKYYVSVTRVKTYSGPGTNYSVTGTRYKNDVIWVRSIKNGWAKFKVNGEWNYVSSKCIKKA